MVLVADKKRRIFYPDSDGKPFAEGERLRLYDSSKGEFLPTVLEQAERLQDAETELARLWAKIETLRAKSQNNGGG